MKETENILRIFKETKKSLENQTYGNLKSLSDQTINTASLTQDPDNIAVAVIIYSLGKIFIRVKYEKLKEWDKFKKNLILYIDETIKDLEKKDETQTRKDLENIRKSIQGLSGKLKKYIQEVFRKASINKASKIYEHGISMEKTASLLGITMYDLANYTGGKESISETPGKKVDVESRIKLAMEFFE